MRRKMVIPLLTLCLLLTLSGCARRFDKLLDMVAEVGEYEIGVSEVKCSIEYYDLTYLGNDFTLWRDREYYRLTEFNPYSDEIKKYIGQEWDERDGGKWYKPSDKNYQDGEYLIFVDADGQASLWKWAIGTATTD